MTDVMTDLMTALARARRQSRKDRRLRYVYADGTRFRITLRRPDLRCYWTNGVDAGTWEASHDQGEIVPSWGEILERT